MTGSGLPMSMLPTGEAVGRSHFDARVVDESGTGAQLVAAANALLERGDELVGKALAAPMVARFEGALVSAMNTVGAVVSQVAEGNGSGILAAASEAMAPQRTLQPAVQLRQKLLRIHQWPELMPGINIEIRCLEVELPRVNANFTRVVECPRSAVRSELGVSTRPPPVARHGATVAAAASSGASAMSMHAVHSGVPAAADAGSGTSSTPTTAAAATKLKVGSGIPSSSTGSKSLARVPPQPLSSHASAVSGGGSGGIADALASLLSPEPPTPYGMLSAQSPVSFFPTTYVAPTSEHAAAARARNVPVIGGSTAGGAATRGARCDGGVDSGARAGAMPTPSGSSSAADPNVHLTSRRPVWNADSHGLILKFMGGRIQIASSKNYLLEVPAGGGGGSSASHACCQVGKMGKNQFSCDFRHPFCALQAFAVLLSATHWLPDIVRREADAADD